VKGAHRRNVPSRLFVLSFLGLPCAAHVSSSCVPPKLNAGPLMGPAQTRPDEAA
jgi:hypothetical protein